jgi:hypothetical protein
MCVIERETYIRLFAASSSDRSPTPLIMKFIFAILALLGAILVRQSWAGPVGGSEQSVDSRLGIPNMNCVIHCVQQEGQESEGDSTPGRGIFSNYAALLNCMKKCG